MHHNELVNVWSHLAGAIILGVILYIMVLGYDSKAALVNNI